jgi:hypothetical protein
LNCDVEGRQRLTHDHELSSKQQPNKCGCQQRPTR